MESKTKELVKAGHELVVLLGNQHGMIDAASLVQRLTAQLDITAIVLREKSKQCDQLAAENAALKDLARGWANATDDRLFEEHGEIFHDSIQDCEAELKRICPATDAWQREQMAKGVEAFADTTEKNGWHHTTTAFIRTFAAQLRNGEAV